MNFTHFLEILLQQFVFIVSGLMEMSMQPLTKQEWTEFSLRNNVYNAKYNVEKRLEHGFYIDFAYFQ